MRIATYRLGENLKLWHTRHKNNRTNVRRDIMKLKRLSGAAAMVPLLAVLTPANAQAQPPPPPDNWGQEVKSCNLQEPTPRYPGATSRGGYVNGEAQDNEAPGTSSRTVAP
jgi:hypothetical protein